MTTIASADVEAAYETCERITRAEARNFAYGIRLLPTDKRHMLSAVYAYARRIDDIGDGDLPPQDKLDLLDHAATALHPDGAALAASEDPVLLALDDAAGRGVHLEPFDELIDGCRDDVLGRDYETADELYDYCRKVAGSIGRLSLDVFGTRDPERARGLADALGIALQLTNILRDVLEDARAGRVYLPAEDRDRFGCPLELGADGWIHDDLGRVAELISFEAGRARAWYAQGLALLPLLDRRSTACCAALAGIYLQLLDLIEADPARVLRGRTSVPTRAKVSVVARALSRGTP